MNAPAGNPPPLRCGLILLAAGASTRMGRPKQLLEFEGKPMIVRAVDAALAGGVWPVIVVLGANAEQIRPRLARHPVLVVENETWSEGMASSIRTGVQALAQFSRAMEGVVLALCDQPHFSSAAVEALRRTQRDTGATIVAARYDGHAGPPALFLQPHFAALAALTGEQGARTLIIESPTAVAHVDLPELARDLDTPGDYTSLVNPGSAGGPPA